MGLFIILHIQVNAQQVLILKYRTAIIKAHNVYIPWIPTQRTTTIIVHVDISLIQVNHREQASAYIIALLCNTVP